MLAGELVDAGAGYGVGGGTSRRVRGWLIEGSPGDADAVQQQAVDGRRRRHGRRRRRSVGVEFHGALLDQRRFAASVDQRRFQRRHAQKRHIRGRNVKRRAREKNRKKTPSRKNSRSRVPRRCASPFFRRADGLGQRRFFFLLLYLRSGNVAVTASIVSPFELACVAV